MARCAIDHITVTASSLESGAAYVADSLGVAMQPGGEHPAMGTHNQLLRLGDDVFLEVIAVNPAARAPKRPRWFELDSLGPGAPPKLATWVARPADLRATIRSSPEDLGTMETLSRGTLKWRLTVPPDGSLPLGGVAPALIEWLTPSHPARSMKPSGCTLHALELFHPDPARVTTLLAALGLGERVHVRSLDSGLVPCLVGHVDTPTGRRVIGADAR